ncbi:hypothetical protein BC567DRAFT_221853 [Phyllosticta citribraziliensis]
MCLKHLRDRQRKPRRLLLHIRCMRPPSARPRLKSPHLLDYWTTRAKNADCSDKTTHEAREKAIVCT